MVPMISISSVPEHIHKGGELGIQIALNLDKLNFPVGEHFQLIQIIHQISGVPAIFIQVRNPRLNRKADAYHRCFFRRRRRAQQTASS